MSYSSFIMWGTLSLMAFGGIGGAIVKGDLIGTFQEAYPSDLAKKDALYRCSEADASFSKFSQADRENCYRILLRPSPM
jgi:hypothetical protein